MSVVDAVDRPDAILGLGSATSPAALKTENAHRAVVFRMHSDADHPLWTWLRLLASQFGGRRSRPGVDTEPALVPENESISLAVPTHFRDDLKQAAAGSGPRTGVDPRTPLSGGISGLNARVDEGRALAPDAMAPTRSTSGYIRQSRPGRTGTAAGLMSPRSRPP